MSTHRAIALVPRPLNLHQGERTIGLDATSRLNGSPECTQVTEYLREQLRHGTGLPVLSGGGVSGRQGTSIFVRLADEAELQSLPAGPQGQRTESYRLVVEPGTIVLVGGGLPGAFYAAQTLLQLLPPQVYRSAAIPGVDWKLPEVTIEDAPSFNWRGVMLDVARHFSTVYEVRRLIDQLAMHKLNRLHLHLTEDQGWRLEIKKYPRLTEVGAWRPRTQRGAHRFHEDGTLEVMGYEERPHGGYYTHDDIREIVAYAAERFITVVPEIETPGHVSAALAAYPDLGVNPAARKVPVSVMTEWGVSHDVLNAEQSTLRFFTDVFDEVMELFPSEYIGLGGDECPKDQWEADARTQQRMRELGVNSGEELQAWMVSQFAAHLESKGRRAFGWDEILEGDAVSKSATVLSWRGMQGAITAARRGYDVISTPDDQVYLDYRQSDLDTEPIPVAVVVDVERVYAFNPVPPELNSEEAAHVIGGQANLWTEHLDTARARDYMLFPRVSALSEALWSADAASPRVVREFLSRLDSHLARLEAMGVEFRHTSGPRPWQQRPGVQGRPVSAERHQALISELTNNISE